MSVNVSAGEEGVLAELARARVLPVVAIDDASVVGEVCSALIAGGLTCIEITFRTDAAVDAMARAASFNEMLVGAGTVLSREHARAARDAGAKFAVAPCIDDDVVSCCETLDLPFFPGVATPSELGHALRLGRTTVKVFPASTLGGPPFLRAVAATYPQARFIPTGGIDAGTLRSYLDVPAVVACGGSWICDQRLIREHRFDEIERRAAAAAALAE